MPCAQQPPRNKQDAALEKVLLKQLNPLRLAPLGEDRYLNRYWFFPQLPDRIFVETKDASKWGYYTTKAEVFFPLLIRSCFVHSLTLFHLNLDLDRFTT